MSHPMPPIASFASPLRGSSSTRRASVWLVTGLALVTLVACGSGDESAEPPSETLLVDAVTGEPVEAPDDFSLNFDAPADQPDGAVVADGADVDEPEGADRSEPVDADAPEQAPDPAPAPGGEDGGDGADDVDEVADDEHPLENVVIDTVVVDPDAAPVLDEAAALACANAEFAMDALIEAAPDRTERFAAAAEWAAQSAYQPVQAFAERLAADPTGAEANDLVVAVLEACAAAGYEL
ncbi:MAG: hypothetical protein ACE367_19585 [Acidimicrobiales bacterium]